MVVGIVRLRGSAALRCKVVVPRFELAGNEPVVINPVESSLTKPAVVLKVSMIGGRSFVPVQEIPRLLNSSAGADTTLAPSFATRSSATPPEAKVNPNAVVGSAIGVARSLVDLPYACTPELVNATPFSVLTMV